MKHTAAVTDHVAIVEGRHARPSEITLMVGRYDGVGVDLSPSQALELAAHLVLAAKAAEETRPETVLRAEVEELRSSNERLQDLFTECQRQLRGADGTIVDLRAKLQDLRART